MSRKDAKVIGMIGVVGAALVATHGITSKRWQTWHTVFVIAATFANMAPTLIG